MKISSHKIGWKLLAGLIVLLAIVLVSLSSISATPFLEGNKSVSPNILYVGESATITLFVNGAGTVSTAAGALDLILIVDNSCSMQGTKLSNAKSAANAIIDELNSLFDRVGLVSFNTYPTVRSALTNDYNSVRNKLNSLSPCGKTNIGEAIKLASGQFSSTSKVKAIVLVSDGKTNLPADAKAYALQQANEAAAKNITFYTVGVGEGFTNIDSTILRSIATAGNGLYWHYPFDDSIDNVFYAITQQTTNLAGKNIIIRDVLALGVVPVLLPSECNYTVNTRMVSCNAGSLVINESRSFSFNVTVYNSSLVHLNEIAFVNYTNYQDVNTSFILNNPLVSILTNNTTCPDCNTTNNTCVGNVAPVVTIISPTNRLYNNSLIGVNISASDSNLANIWYNINGSNLSYSGSSIANLSNGSYRLYAYANDSCGSLSSAYVDFVINTSASVIVDNFGPNVTIISPVNQIYTTHSVRLNITAIDDVAVDKVWYTLNGVLYNYNTSYLMNLSNGNYTILAYANDSSGNVGLDSVSFIVNVSENPDCDVDPNCEACRSHTRAPVNDFDNSEEVGSVSMDDDYVVALNYQNNSVNEGFSMDSYISGKTNQLIFNMILLIAIVVLLLLVVLVGRKN
jgi:uncharacterized protein YegL